MVQCYWRQYFGEAKACYSDAKDKMLIGGGLKTLHGPRGKHREGQQHEKRSLDKRKDWQ